MEDHDKVFKSKITNTFFEPKNNLYELLSTTQVLPVETEVKKSESCDFKPKIDKFYIPKRKSKLRVKTVRDIRKTFEQDMYNHYSEEIEKQGTVLLSRIKSGLANDEVTRRMARNILNSDTPVTRSAWQMLSNINPDKYPNHKQYILLNGKPILVNGSKGGKQRIIGQININISPPKKAIVINKMPKRKGLLQNSLVVKFKPGPLQKKKYLDDSHQKFNLGNTELIDLPKLGLAISPTYGVALDPNVSYFLNNLRNKDGWLTENWAEFAVSVLGTVKDCNVVQSDSQAITFDIDYKLNQKRILMRRDFIDEETNFFELQKNETLTQLSSNDCDVSIEAEVRNVMDNILQSVEISIQQDTFFTGEDEPRQIVCNDLANLVKGKNKKKYCELDRLDVTVIRLPENKRCEDQTCNKPYCTLGCVCKSLDCTYKLKNHCGSLGCMFECKCDFSDYKTFEDLQNDCLEIIPGLVNFKNEANLNLAKEEKKFKQTVVLAGEKSIVLKKRKRNCKVTKKYAEYHASTKRFKKSFDEDNTEISITVSKLNFENVEPWCMVHNLYKCFCKGRLTTNAQSLESDEKLLNKSFLKSESLNLNQTLEKTKINEDNFNSVVESKIDELKEQYTTPSQNNNNSCLNVQDYNKDCKSRSCARIQPYLGRKHDANYYKEIQSKITSMERNDHQLLKRITRIQNNLENEVHDDNTIVELEDKKIHFNDVDDHKVNETRKLKRDDLKILSEPLSLLDIINSLSNQYQADNCFGSVTSKKCLVKWIEKSYKLFKNRVSRGLKVRLDPPTAGSLAMHPWDFILSRYRERKNLFMVSKTEPFRIFISVHIQNPFFNECMNIDKIRFVDLQKYPLTIKNLLTNATDLKETYCLLYGFSDWWELVGTIAKVQTNEDNIKFDGQGTSTSSSPSTTRERWTCSPSDDSCNSSKFDEDSWSYSILDNDASTDQMLSFSDVLNDFPKETSNNTPHNTSKRFSSKGLVFQQTCTENTTPQQCVEPNEAVKDFSKWFVMTVENDFSEIRFNKGGFFVTYEKIIKSINVARSSGKSVRLSSQKCAKNSDPQYGLYTIPKANEYCVFIGPYETHESLGIQTIKKIAHLRKLKKTRGIWITTDKKDNHKLVDNPISFIPNLKKGHAEMLPLQDYYSLPSADRTSTEVSNLNITGIISPEKKIIRINRFSPQKTQSLPTIKIKRTNDFYHIATNGSIKTVTNWNPTVFTDDSKSCSRSTETSLGINDDSNVTKSTETASQVSKSHSELVMGDQQKKMFILKPEQINNKMLLSNTLSRVVTICDKTEKETKITDENVNRCNDTETMKNVYLISDDDDDSSEKDLEKVWIQCSNVKNFGWIQGTRNSDNFLSLQFPGFKPANYIPECEAFSIINKTLNRMIKIPKNLVLEWQVLDSENALDSDPIQIDKLDNISINKDITFGDQIMIREAVKHTYKNPRRKDSSSKNSSKQISDYISDLEKESKKLEDESNTMWKETLTNKQEILASLTDTELKESMTEKLKVIKSMADKNK